MPSLGRAAAPSAPDAARGAGPRRGDSGAEELLYVLTVEAFGDSEGTKLRVVAQGGRRGGMLPIVNALSLELDGR